MKDNGTKLERFARGAPNLPLHSNSAGTDVEYTKLEVAGGGTGATSLTGVVVGTGATAMTVKANPTGAFLGDSDTQNVTGAKTFLDTTFKLRNPANTFSTTFRGPTITTNNDFRFSYVYDALIFIIGSTIYVKNGRTGTIDHSGTDFGIEVKWAFDNILTVGRNYKEKVVCRGSFTLNDSLILPDYLIFEGPCKITAKNSFAVSPTPRHMISYSTTPSRLDVHDIEIRNIEIDGNYANQTASCNGLIGGAHDLIVENCNIHDCYTTGVQDHEDYTNNVHNQRMVKYLNNKVHHNRHIGLYFGYGVSDSLFMGNECYSNGGDGVEGAGIFLDGDGDNNKIVNNWCYSNVKTGCYITEQSNFFLSGLTTYSNGNNGLVIAGTNNMTPPNMPAYRNIIENVQTHDNTLMGVWAHGTINTTFSNIISYNNTQEGLTMSCDNGTTDPQTDTCTVRDSLFYGNGFGGIVLRGAAALKALNVTIQDCVCKNHPVTKGGITISQCQYVRLIGNSCYDDQGTPTQQYGLVLGSTADTVYVLFNNTRGNTTRGVQTAATNVTYLGNNEKPNANYDDWSTITIPADPAASTIRQYAKAVDANNDGQFYKTKVNGTIVEVAV